MAGCRLHVIAWLSLAVLSILPARAVGQYVCPGDCDGGGSVTINELIRGVNIALGTAAPEDCPAFDTDDSGGVTIDELIAAVNNALTGCPEPTPTATPSGPTPTVTPNRLTLAPIGDRTVALGSTLSLDLSAFDPQGRTLAFSAAPVPLPANARLDGLTGRFTFAPHLEQVGALTLTFSVRAGEASVSETVTITVTGALPGGETALTGRILDTNDFVQDITTPVVGATVSIRGTGLTGVSDASGRFTLRGMRAGAQVFDIDTSTANPAPDGSPYAGFHQGIELIEGVVNVVERPFFLPRIALESITEVDPGTTTTVRNPTLGVTLTIPANTARAEDGLPFDGSLSISGVPEGLAPEALPEGVDPGMLITIQPLGVTFDTPVPITFPNTDGLRPGTEVDLWSLDPETGQFLVVGTGRVRGDGAVIETISGGVRAADWHFFLPLQGVIEAITNLFNPPGMSCPVGSETSVSSGELSEEHVLASYRSFDTPRSLRFVYGSLRADPQPIIGTTMTVPVRAAVPPKISARLSVGGIDQGQPAYTDTRSLNEDRNETIRQAVQFDASALPTGLYPYTLALTSHYAMSGVDTTVADEVVVHNERDSVFGAGWTLSDLQRLHRLSEDEFLLVSGDGTTTRFQSPLGTWRKRPALPDHPPIPGTRGYVSAVALDDGIHVIGGAVFISGFGNPTSVAHDVYDPESNSWSLRAPVPDTLTASAQLVVLDGKIYMIGGSFGAPNRVYDPAQDAWAYLARTPGDGYGGGHVAGAVEGKIYVIGGANPEYYPGYPIRSYDPASDTWSAPLGSIPIGRFSQSGAVIGDEIYVVGTGVELQIYKPATNTWRRGADVPTATWVPNVAVFNGKLYVVGGASIEPNFSGWDLTTVQIYDPSTDTWTTGPPMPTSRGWAGAGVFDGKLYVFGGFDAARTSTSANEELTLAFDGPPVYPGPPGDFSRLVLNADGTFTRELPDGTRVHFDAAGRQTSVVERTGRTTRFEYDGSDHLIRITDPAGLATTLNYAGDRLFEVVDPAGRHTSFEHDAAGNLARITDPDGSSRQFRYDSRHRLISQTSKRGFETTYAYDFAGRNVLASHPDGSTRAVDPSETTGLANPATGLGSEAQPLPVVRPAQLESAFTDGNGNTTRFTTDGFGNGAVRIDALGRTTRTVRDGDGLPAEVTRPDGVRTTATYDGRGNRLIAREAVGLPEERQVITTYEDAFSQPTSITDVNGNRSTLEYDGAGNPTRITDAVGMEAVLRYEDPHCPGLATSTTTAPGRPEETTATFAYDPATCNLVRLTDPATGVSTFQRDAAGNVVEVVDGTGNRTRFHLDMLNRIARVIDPTNAEASPSCGAPGVTCSTYDPQGNLTSVTDGRGGVTYFEYDAVERLLFHTDPLGHVDVVAYDANGNAASVTDANGQMSHYDYDAVNRRVTETVRPGPDAEVTTSTFDMVGNLTAVMDPAAALTMAFDHADDWTAATLAGTSGLPQSNLSYTRTKSGQPATLSVTTGTNPAQGVAYTYDGVNRLRTLTAQGPVAFGYEYAYDAAGRPTSRQPLAGQAGVATSFTFDAGARLTRLRNQSPDGNAVFDDVAYTYDAVGNALSATDGAGQTSYTYDGMYRLTEVGGPGIAETYTYDGLGNRLSKNGTTYTYDPGSRLLSSSNGAAYTYDANGKLRTKTVGGATTTYHWNARQQLTRIDFPDASFAAYTYDAMGRRLSKRDRAGAVRYYVYDGADLVQELDATGAVIASYVYDAVDHPLSMRRGGVTYYYLYDRLGSVIGLTDGAGALVVRYRYDPWGNLLATGGSNPGLENPFRFTGREWDAESGLYYYRLRYYDPALGRFISRDPFTAIGMSGYAYVGNNPVNAVDPTGLMEISARRTLQVLGGIAVGLGTGAVVVATLPGWLAGGAIAAAGSGAVAVATAATAAVAGTAAGAATGVGIELVAGNRCDRDFFGAAKAGAKGGFVGGTIAGTLGQTSFGASGIGPFRAAIDAGRAGFGAGLSRGTAGLSEAVAGFVPWLATLPPAQAGLAVGGVAVGGGLAVVIATQSVRGILWVYDTAVNGRRW